MQTGAQPEGGRLYDHADKRPRTGHARPAVNNLMRWTVPPTGIAMCQSAGA